MTPARSPEHRVADWLEALVGQSVEPADARALIEAVWAAFREVREHYQGVCRTCPYRVAIGRADT